MTPGLRRTGTYRFSPDSPAGCRAGLARAPPRDGGSSVQPRRVGPRNSSRGRIEQEETSMPRRMTLVALAALAGCAHVGPGGGPEADRVQVPESERLDGRVVVQLDPETDRVLDPSYAGPLPDRPALLALAVGAAARDEALKAFGAYFRGGAEAKAAGAPSRGYRVLVVPR